MEPIALCAVALAGLLVAEGLGWLPGKWIFKPVASVAFVWAGVAAGSLQTSYGRWILVGLCLCWVGDLLLVPVDNARWFRAGVGAFLLGHLAYTAAFLTRPLGLGTLVGSAVLATLAGWGLLRWLTPHLPPSLRTPVITYLVVISAMVSLAVAVAGGGGPLVVAVGALGFAVSDVAVVKRRFMGGGFATRAWGLALYYGSQLLIAFSPLVVG